MIASKIYESSLHINPSFRFYHLSGQNPAACIHPNTSFKNLQYTRMVGGGKGKLPTACFIHICDLASIRIFLFGPVPELLAKTHQASFPILRSAHLTHLHRKYMGRGYAAILNIGLTSMSDQLSQPDLLYTHKINPV